MGQYFTPGSGGANQTWNYSSITQGESVTQTYVTVASTGQAASFPGATIATDAGGGNFSFASLTSAGWDLHGVYAALLGGPMVYQNPERMLTFPCSYNSNWNDSLSSNFTSMGISVVRSGTITGLADGYGTVIMPYGTVSNVLRVRTVEDYSDVLAGLGTIEYDYTNHFYYKPGIHNPIVSLYSQQSTFMGETETEQSSAWLTSAAVGIEEALRNAIGIDVFPNPATDQVSVVYSSEGGRLIMEVLDATGRVAITDRLNAQPMGIGRHDLDVSALPAGLYMLRITAENGQQGVKRLVVN